jgi:hypothetical protein
MWDAKTKNSGVGNLFSASSWDMHYINANAGAHDIKLADLDGDNLMDVVCSGSSILNSGIFLFSPYFLSLNLLIFS